MVLRSDARSVAAVGSTLRDGLSQVHGVVLTRVRAERERCGRCGTRLVALRD